MHDDGSLYRREMISQRVSLRCRRRRMKQNSARDTRTPKTLSGPINLTCSSVMVPSALPCPSVWKLPRSPTWRSLSVGAPCVLEKGLTGLEKVVRVSHVFSLWVPVLWKLPMLAYDRMLGTYSGGRHSCNHWYCPRTDARECPVSLKHHCP